MKPVRPDPNATEFVGVVEEIYPKSLEHYKELWRQFTGQDFPEEEPLPLEPLKRFVLLLWKEILSAGEIRGVENARSSDELEAAIEGPMWLLPRRVRLKVTEQFSGDVGRQFVLFTGVGCGDCGVAFEVGRAYLIDATRDQNGRWYTTICSKTQTVEAAGELLKRLRSQRK